VINAKRDISVSFARKLEGALDIGVVFWVNLRANYDGERSGV